MNTQRNVRRVMPVKKGFDIFPVALIGALVVLIGIVIFYLNNKPPEPVRLSANERMSLRAKRLDAIAAKDAAIAANNSAEAYRQEDLIQEYSQKLNPKSTPEASSPALDTAANVGATAYVGILVILMYLCLIFVVGILPCILCWKSCVSKNIEPVVGLFVGLFFSWFGYLVIACLPYREKVSTVVIHKHVFANGRPVPQNELTDTSEYDDEIAQPVRKPMRVLPRRRS